MFCGSCGVNACDVSRLNRACAAKSLHSTVFLDSLFTVGFTHIRGVPQIASSLMGSHVVDMVQAKAGFAAV